MQRPIAFLHQPIAACAQQGSVDVKDRSAYRNPALGKSNPGLFQGNRQHTLWIHAGSVTLAAH
jgi:hypothetical protein